MNEIKKYLSILEYLKSITYIHFILNFHQNNTFFQKTLNDYKKNYD